MAGGRRVFYYCNGNRTGACDRADRIYEDDLLETVRERVQSLIEGRTVTIGRSTADAEVKKSLVALESQRRRIVDAYATGAVSVEELARHREATDRRAVYLES